MTARTLMIQGTASHVGKSLLVAALCRVFRDDGLEVAPFKAQNMSLNAFVTADGLEMGRAQASQAAAARLIPSVDMNPILLKPEGGGRVQVVVSGKAAARDQVPSLNELRSVVAGALDRLRAAHDLVVIEGAGSPVEVNLKANDLVNMFVAELADAPVLLVGDIDRGGVFASLLGTLALFEPEERARVRGLVVNKFRGDLAGFASGVEALRERSGLPVVGVVPFLRDLDIPDEDSVALDERRSGRRARPDEIEIAIVRLPALSNHDDFQPLEREPGTVVRYVETPRDLEGADLVMIPGTKTTISDLKWLERSGFADAIVARARRGEPVLGICGGCQMLGTALHDPDGVESTLATATGLGLLPLVTRFARTKRTAQTRLGLAGPSFFGSPSNSTFTGYEIHLGRVDWSASVRPLFAVLSRNGVYAGENGVVHDGAISGDGSVVGTMMHGLFENSAVRHALLNHLRTRRGLPAGRPSEATPPDPYARLASAVRAHLDLPLIRSWLRLPR
jgi:adenosylcobyric acid synthase